MLLGGRGKGIWTASPCCFSHVGPFASGFSPLLALGSASLQECGAVPVATGPASPPCSGSASEPHIVPPWPGLTVPMAAQCSGWPRGHSAQPGRGRSAGAWKRAPSQCASTIVLTPRHMVPSKTAKRNPTADAAKAESWQETARPAKCLLRRRCVVSQQAGSSPGLAPCTPGPFHVPDPLQASGPALWTCAGAEQPGCCGGVRAGWVCAAQPGPSLLVSVSAEDLASGPSGPSGPPAWQEQCGTAAGPWLFGFLFGGSPCTSWRGGDPLMYQPFLLCASRANAASYKFTYNLAKCMFVSFLREQQPALLLTHCGSNRGA